MPERNHEHDHELRHVDHYESNPFITDQTRANQLRHPNMSYIHHSQTALNPSIPPFQPAGAEVHVAHYTYSDPRTSSSALADTRALVLQSSLQMGREMAHMEMQIKNNTEDIQSTNEAFRDDMQSLQGIINDLQVQVNDLQKLRTDDKMNITVSEDVEMARAVQQFKNDNSVEPTEALKQQAGNDEALAEAYLEHAEDAEKFAAKLRERGHALLETISTPKQHKQITATISKPTSECETPKETYNYESERNHIIEVTDWTPKAVRDMPVFKGNIPKSSVETFTKEFIVSMLGGEVWSPGFYFVTRDSTVPISSKGYWVLKAEWEPFLPKSPGLNGAKLTAFFNDTFIDDGGSPSPDNYMDTPIFIQPTGSEEYVYFGQYSQTRFSDKLDIDTITSKVPEKVRICQAEQYADPGRPSWVTQALMQHFWPKPAYEGPLPDDDNKSSVSKALWEYAEELTQWEKDAKLKANLLNQDVLMKSFENADTDVEPGLRMHWEYMQCVSYNEKLYNDLVQHKLSKLKTADATQAKHPSPAVQADSSKRYRDFAGNKK